MAELPIYKSLLLRTSAATDFQVSGRVISVAGLNPITKNNLTSIQQVKYRAAIAQVYTVGDNSYSPVGATLYRVSVSDPNRRVSAAQEQVKYYGYTTPTDVTTLGITTALQREAIHAKIVTAINADLSDHATAASLGGGAGFTITDNSDYYPVHAQSMTNVLFVNQVIATGGFTSKPTLTTVGVFSVGVGAKLAGMAASADWMSGGSLVSGLPIYPKTVAGLPAVSGQNYDQFVIQSLALAPNETASGQQVALVNQIQEIYVDNGAGSSVTNLAGFISFEREFLRAVADFYSTDPIAQSDFFDNALTGPTVTTTGLPVASPAADNVAISVNSGAGVWYYNPIGAATIPTPIVTANGLPLTLDAVTQEGYELSAPILTQSPKQFVVGKTEASFYARINIGATLAATSFRTLSFGFRKKAAYAVDQTAYEAASVATAALGFKLNDTVTQGLINIITGPGAAGVLTNTSTGVTLVATNFVDLYITVDINGVANFYVNGSNKTGLLVATYTFTAGLVLIPFISCQNGAAANAAPFLVQAVFTPTKQWRA